MPLTSKGNKILASMQEEYGAKKGEEVFYASKNKGTISGVDAEPLSREDERMLEEELIRVMRTATSASDPNLREIARKRAIIIKKRLDLDSAMKDMAPAEFEQLRGLLSKFLGEEAKEPEHQMADADSHVWKVEVPGVSLAMWARGNTKQEALENVLSGTRRNELEGKDPKTFKVTLWDSKARDAAPRPARHVHIHYHRDSGIARTLTRGTKDVEYNRERHGPITVTPADHLFKAVSRGRGLLAWGKTKEEAANKLADQIEKTIKDAKAKDCSCKGTKDGRRVVQYIGSFAVFEDDLKGYFVATRTYPAGGVLPSGQYVEWFGNEGQARSYARELAKEYG